jgi:hypothetical protein
MNNLDSALVEMAELLATWRREIAEAGPLNKRDLRPSRFADDLDTLRTRLAGNAHGIANHGDERASKETLVQCDCGCGRSCCACCGTDLGFIAEQPATPAGGGDDSASYWVAEREGIIEFGMSTDDANDGGASREEVNDWINDQHAPGTYRLRRLASTQAAGGGDDILALREVFGRGVMHSDGRLYFDKQTAEQLRTAFSRLASTGSAPTPSALDKETLRQALHAMRRCQAEGNNPAWGRYIANVAAVLDTTTTPEQQT